MRLVEEKVKSRSFFVSGNFSSLNRLIVSVMCVN